MKNLFYTACLLFVCQSSFAQNGVYLITATFSGGSSALDNVYVTSPTGVTTTTAITHFITNPAAHDSQLSIIINGITSLGYKVIDFGLNHGDQLGNYTRTFFLSQPWTLASQELESANSTQLNISKIYPNPTAGIATFEYTFIDGNAPLELIVYNIAGFIVQRRNIKNDKSGLMEFDVSGIPNGEYFVTLINNKTYCEAQKIIVKR